MELTKIVITGGPCGGKSTALDRIREEFSRLGYTVLFVPETATELIGGGVAPWTCGTNGEYQKCQMKLQLEKEAIFEQGARTMPVEKILLVCDRGALDNKAYMNDEEFAQVLRFVGRREGELRDSYDAVFHLVTAAKGAEEFYTTANNTARTETVEEAAALDDKIIAAWTGHPHLRIIGNAWDFEEKLGRLVTEIASFLGEPEPLEIERKFLISYPDADWLEAHPACRRVEILQTYLKTDDGGELRVRQRGTEGDCIWFRTEKRVLTDARRVEVERRISREEYLALLEQADPARRPLRKTRYCLTYENQYFEIDLYPFWNDRAVVEIELTDENAGIDFPPELHVIREVTGEEEYRNAALAERN